MAIADDIAQLQRIPLFQAFEQDHLRILAFACEAVRLNEGDTLFREGANADSAFLLTAGALELVQGEGRLASSRVVGPGAVLGELAAIATGVRPQTARALQPCRLLRIARSSLQRLLEEYPDLARAMHRQVAARLAAMTAAIGTLQPHFDALDEPSAEPYAGHEASDGTAKSGADDEDGDDG